MVLSHLSRCEVRFKKKEYKYKIDKEKAGKDVYKFYYFVRDILNIDKLSEHLLEKIDKDAHKKESLSKSERYKYFKISNLFEGNKKLGSAGKFWMIIYNMNDKSVQSLYQLLTKHEQNIFNLFLQFFNNNKFEDIDKFIGFTKSLDFYNDDLTIINLEADQEYVDLKIKKYEKNKNDANERELKTFKTTVLDFEKKKFENINYFTSEIDQNAIDKLYDNLIHKIEDIFIADKATKEKQKLKEKFDNLLKKIKKISENQQQSIKNYKASLMEQIKISTKNGDFDENLYNMYENKYEQLKKNSEDANKVSSDLSYNIRWPILMKDKTLTKSKTSLFIEILIWYSKIKNNIDNIKINNKNKNNKFKYVLQLQDFDEMKYASNLIISTEELTEDEFSMIYATLNSYYINKMIKNNLEQYLYNSAYEINKIIQNNLLLEK